jgi:SAM-dependent methyltransferase
MPEKHFQYNNRLALYKSWSNNPDDWEKKWDGRIAPTLERHKDGYLGEFEIITSYLPREMPILEAGCGMGQYVKALSTRGYMVEGVDYAEKTIAEVKRLDRELQVKVGDVYSLDVQDGYYGAIISFGVLEHNSTGPQSGLTEFHRALRDGGKLIVSVPYLNPVRSRWLKQVLPIENPFTDDGLKFYQGYFSIEEFKSILEEERFKLIDTFPYALYAGLTRDFSIGRRLEANKFFSTRVRFAFEYICEHAPKYTRYIFAHMMLYICQRV